MSKPAEASEAVPSHVQDSSLAWEERRKTWLEPNRKGKRRATQAATTRLEKVLVPKSKAEEASADKIILGIKARLAGKEGLKEPMQLRLMVSILYKSWLLDGTITKDMLKEGRAGTDNEGQKKV